MKAIFHYNHLSNHTVVLLPDKYNMIDKIIINCPEIYSTINAAQFPVLPRITYLETLHWMRLLSPLVIYEYSTLNLIRSSQKNPY